MDLGLKGRVALVAAASGGIGYASALELAREGARVLICSRDEGRIREAAEKIRAEAGAVEAGLAADGVTINNVAPGWTLTARQEEHAVERGARLGKSREEMIEGWAAEVPMRRMARPEEIAAAVAFLASERASYITGQTVVIDGGWVKD